MKVFLPFVADGFEWVKCIDSRGEEPVLSFDGARLGGRWDPLRVRIIREDEGMEFATSDFPWWGAHALVMRSHAVDVLRDMLDSCGEVLPLRNGDGQGLYVFNASAVDGLDEQRSCVLRFGDGRIMHIEKPEFLVDVIAGLDLFRLPHRASPTYVSERFVRRVCQERLVGLEFNEVWGSD